ncbi:MAG: N-acetylglucosamine-6-phosphate deacetylase [Rhodoferax sp.]|uniref:N-acetylglucosamine-6-phosphate deacetylase n=1 Tax=Rhodoferax sp. TaxID=50421 RepID=UPI00262F825E|nr:N-acetylglucosamine-6-phosphate deacetylase [Rhodoferax sp.]MDD5335208.1 N-acetylglucosamine-6-phosphate deacetylase [Rhodoferax sp.]
MKTLAGNILTPQGFVRGQLELGDDGRVARIAGEPVTEQEARDGQQALVLPGFIDLHVHGGGGRDIMEGGDALARVSELHASHGTTALLATTMTASAPELEAAFLAMQALGSQRRPGAARVLGVHLEGPYINPGKLGAQPDFARTFAMSELQRLHDLFPIRLITLAPEVPGNMEVIESLCVAGFRVQIGHTLGSYEEGLAALSKGAGGFTHLFNAMTGLQQRAPGMVGLALAHADYAEIIPDLIHVHAGAIRVALRAIPGLYCVTDSTAASGMPDGEYRLGSHTVTKCLGGVRLADGTLAGSALTMDQALRNLVNALGLTLPDASRRVSTHAADYLGLTDRGRLAVGAWGDVVLLDRDLKLLDVYLEGSSIEHANAD